MELATSLGHTCTVPGPWKTLAEIKRANAACGGLFFGPGKGPPQQTVFQGRVILTADEDFDGKRVFHLHAVLDDGHIELVGDTLGYGTIIEALGTAGELCLEPPSLPEIDAVVTPSKRVRPSSLAEQPEL